MIRSTIEYLNTQIETLNIFSKLNGLTKLWHKGEQVFPALYSGSGDSEAINFDYSLSSLYHRITGEIKIEQSEEAGAGCDILITETYPLKLVCYFPNLVLGEDDSYSALRVSSNIKNLIPSINLSTIANTFKLDGVELVVNSINLDSFDVWETEFKGIDFTLPSDKNLISIDYSIILTGSQNCFENYVCQ